MKNRKYSDSPLFAILMIFVMWFVLYLANQDLLLAEPRIGVQSAPAMASKYVMLEQDTGAKAPAKSASQSVASTPITYTQLEPVLINSMGRRVMEVNETSSFFVSLQFLWTVLFVALIIYGSWRYFKMSFKEYFKD